MTAQDKATGKEQTMQIIPSSGLSDDEIEGMVNEAEQNKEQDELRKAHIEARNQADTLVFAAEKTLREQGEQIPAELKAEVEEKIEAVKKSIEQDDMEAITQTTADLGQTLQKIGTEMYGAGGTPPPGAAPGGPAPDADGQPDSDDEDVVEGEFTEAS